MPGFLSSASQGSAFSVGEPTDGSFLDGALDILASDKIADAFDKINEHLVDLESGQGAPSTVDVTCDASVSTGDLVYLNPTTAVAYRALATSISTSHIVGYVVSKANSTTASIAQFGTANKSGLTTGANYFLSSSTAGGVQLTSPGLSGQVTKLVGVALSPTSILFNLGATPFVIKG